MKTEQREDGWWITDCPPGVEEMGPYPSRKEAEEDRRGVQRSLDEFENLNGRTN